MSTRFPDFFLIGAPKCGTTSLFSWLAQHPDTYLPIKEPNFYSQDILDVRAQAGFENEAAYLARLCPPEAQGKWTGEATPKYLYSDQALARLAREAGRVKLIVSLRNPVDLAVAMHAQTLRQGRERDSDFARAWDRGPARPGERLTDYRFWGRPGARLAEVLKMVPREDILVLILEEEMRQDPAAAHAKVLRFLGLAPHVLDSYAPENVRQTYRWVRGQGALGQIRRAVYVALSWVGIRPQGKTGLLQGMTRLNNRGQGRVEITPAQRQAVARELAEDARHCAALLGRDRLPWPDFDWPAPDRPAPDRLGPDRLGSDRPGARETLADTQRISR